MIKYKPLNGWFWILLSISDQYWCSLCGGGPCLYLFWSPLLFVVIHLFGDKQPVSSLSLVEARSHI